MCPKAYLAGSVAGLDDPYEWREKVSEKMKKYGIEAVFPPGIGAGSASEAINEDMEKVLESDVVFVCHDPEEPSFGTGVEVGIAADKANIPIVLWFAGERDEENRSKFAMGFPDVVKEDMVEAVQSVDKVCEKERGGWFAGCENELV